jgi:hypothetical protein
MEKRRGAPRTVPSSHCSLVASCHRLAALRRPGVRAPPCVAASQDPEGQGRRSGGTRGPPCAAARARAPPPPLFPPARAERDGRGREMLEQERRMGARWGRSQRKKFSHLQVSPTCHK